MDSNHVLARVAQASPMTARFASFHHEAHVLLADVQQYTAPTHLLCYKTRSSTACEWIKYQIPFPATDPDTPCRYFCWGIRHKPFALPSPRSGVPLQCGFIFMSFVPFSPAPRPDP